MCLRKQGSAMNVDVRFGDGGVRYFCAEASRRTEIAKTGSPSK
jgi:hypothetical protein